MIERRMERQQRKLEKEEAKLRKEIERAVEKGDMQTARLYARDIVRNRRMVHGLHQMKSRIHTVVFKLEQAHTTQTIGRDLKGLVKALHQMNKQLKLPQVEGLLNQMEYETEKLDMTTESIDESFEMMSFGGEVEEEEVDKIIGELATAKAVEADMGLPTPDIRSEEIKKELERLKGKSKE